MSAEPKQPESSDEASASVPAEGARRPKLVDIIVEQMFQTCDLFHDERRVAFATILLDDRLATVPVRSPRFRHFIVREVRRALFKVVGRSVLDTVLLALEAVATLERPMRRVHVRVAAESDAIYVDLCNGRGRSRLGRGRDMERREQGARVFPDARHDGGAAASGPGRNRP